jgi:N-acetylgalactosamine-N,N'-diacetylbacillosaminyl-diphospho-undecaprenol 4-alpha-N-acetylgalactosaminyltransferase
MPMPDQLAKQPRKVAFVINSFEGGGAERVLATLLQEVHGGLSVNNDIKPELVLLDDVPARYDWPADVPCHVLGANGTMTDSVRRLLDYTRRRRPDVMLAFLSRANIAAVTVKMRYRVPVLISERVNTTEHLAGGGVRNMLARGLIRALYPRADRVIAVSRGVARDLVDNFRVSPERVHVIHNPYDLDKIRAKAGEAAPADLPARFVVAVGRLTANKNFAMLIRAYARADLDDDLVILGAGELRDELASLVRQLGVERRVRFVGFVTNPYAVMARATAFVSASNVEGFPNAAAEAMALGRPVVLTDCPSGPGELLGGAAPTGSGVTKARYGVLTPVGDEAAMVDALRLIVSPEMRAYGDHARHRMEDFRAAEITRKYIACLAEC